ncbi:universal stress protein [Maribacter sp. 2210JD10-5]|uniref:universal stress protein n=1 Tax=Maribacter sp. 2210JD10-5 TaxID=3386272 RepID=UPI0039BCAE13
MNVLVPTDFSYDAYNALFYATQLYQDQKCTFHILHAYDRQSHFKEEYRTSATTKGLQEFLSNRTAECLRETYHKIMADTDKNPLHEFVTVPKNDTLENAVKEYLGKKTIDLIVMGTKGRTGAMDIFFGGNTIQMVKNNPRCPLLCIPKQMNYSAISQMGYITSFKHTLHNETLKIVKSIAKRHDSALHILHVSKDDGINTSQEKNKLALEKFFEDICLKFHTVPFKKSKAKTVAKFAKDIGINLLVMYYYPHYFLDLLFREPVVLDLSFYTEIPLLILPAQE